MLATNYIGAFCLTKVLLPLLENSPVPSRVVNVTSFTHWSGKIWHHSDLYYEFMMHISYVHNSTKEYFVFCVFFSFLFSGLTFWFSLQFVAHRLTEKLSLESVLWNQNATHMHIFMSILNVSMLSQRIKEFIFLLFQC